MNKKKNTIFENIIHLFYGTVLANVLNATTLILLANYFNSKNYGIFSVALALAMIMGFFTDLGVSNTFLREGSKKENLSTIFSSYIKIRIVWILLAFLVFAGGIHILYQEQQILYMMYSLLIPMVIGMAMQTIGMNYFQLTERMQFIASIRIFTAIALIITTTVSMGLKFEVHLTAFLYGFSYLAGGIYSIYLLRKKVEFKWSSAFEKQLLTNLSPFLISGLLIILSPQIGPLVLEKTLPLTLVGLFAVAYRIPSALYQIPGVIAGAFFPLLFKQYNRGELEEHTRLNILQMKIMSYIGMCMTISLFYLAVYLVSILFGDEWGAAVQPLKILSFIIVLQGFNIAIADGLTTRGLQNRRTIVQFITIAFGLVSFYYLSISYAVAGAAFAVLAMEIISFIGYFLATPIKRMVLTKVIIPYGCYFSISFVLIHYLISRYPFIAMISTFILVSSLILLFDKMIMDLIIGLLKKIKQKNINHLPDRRQS
ncbi:oligosaccharide flippase family protein [Peribacillus frigoritolerans]|uniref:oligosaccharide flippase family protein n=1 Tax=Peribacillus frigoritolerans TaxID=450367 RepID=UPI000FD91FAA|nr:oligosaccharide flippase family protein [Peribacillus frigoritolerans]AZV63426.1 sugar translocase [Peribacillus frigoritolerans]